MCIAKKDSTMNPELNNLSRKVNQYKEVLNNTEAYRTAWKEHLKNFIMTHLNEIMKEVGIAASIEVKTQMENLEAIVLSMGDIQSGMYQKVSEDVQRHLIKHNGSLIYQQLFNGKVIVLINFPYIENYGEPRPPKTLAIYRPEEIKFPFLVRHMEEFIHSLTIWEDYDDDEPNNKIGFKLNFDTPLEE